MIKKQDYIVYDGPPKIESSSAKQLSTNKVQPLTSGAWQLEALDTLKMYDPKDGGFSSIGEQLSLFPEESIPSLDKASALVDHEGDPIQVNHQSTFKFFSKDSLRQVRLASLNKKRGLPAAGKYSDAASATDGKLYVEGVTELKADQFPGRVKYIKGGLYPYPKDPDINLDDPKTVAKVLEENPELLIKHKNAPNFRQMDDGKPVYGVGQPTKQGFSDVLDHLGAKDKPVVWTNTRAEAILYIDGEPYNLREVASMHNLVLKEGATGEEVEALELELKEKVLKEASSNGGTIRVPLEEPGPNGERFKEVKVTPENIQTTKEVIEELKGPPNYYKVEYKRIPLTDEKSPTPAEYDEIRSWLNEVQDKHPESKDELKYVFNCHQGQGRTTTGMVIAGLALDGNDGKTVQLELPFPDGKTITVGETAKERADRIIDEAWHVQNLREAVAEMEGKADKAAADAEKLEAQAAVENDPVKKAKLEKRAETARAKQAENEQKAQDFTKRYAMLQKYSEYLDKFGAHATTPTFEEWLKKSEQVKDFTTLWAALNEKLGLKPPSESSVVFV